MIASESQVQELLKAIRPIAQHGAQLPVQIASVTDDSRKVAHHTLFVAIAGTKTDGHDYIETAIQKGATVIVHQSDCETYHPEICYWQVADSATAFGEIASAYYQHPSKKLQLVGVTGTNGKTSVATFLYHLVENMGRKAGLISTVENRVHDTVYPTEFTTPTPLELQKLLAEMVSQGCEYVFMEVSSHALVQKRTAGTHFVGGIFTNLTRDHLDYHGSFLAYRDAKKSFFDHLPATSFALSNLDDPNGEFMLQNTKARKEYYSLKNRAFVSCALLSQSLEAMQLRFGEIELHVPLLGRFNAYNISVVYGAAILLGFDAWEVQRALTLLRPVRGRLDYKLLADRLAIVDFAHTPDALEKVLSTLTELKPKGADIITVMGAGGDRDQGKRPQMGAAAARYSQRLILTSDNPRHEDPEVIIQQIYDGIPPKLQSMVLCNPDRREAIRTAVALSRKGDFILVAGKGHENYQQVGDVKSSFNDAVELQKALESLK